MMMEKNHAQKEKTMVKMIDYTKGEEIFSGVSHITGAGLGLLGTAFLCIDKAENQLISSALPAS